MATFIKLTDVSDGQPFWLNMDRVEAFYKSPDDDKTSIVYALTDRGEIPPARYVKQSPEQVSDLLNTAQRSLRGS